MKINDSLRRDLARAHDAKRYERVADGRVYVPGARVYLGGVFRTDLNGVDVRVSPNLVVSTGLDDILSAYFTQAAQRTAFFLAPFSANVAIAPTLTAATFAATQQEFVAYTGATRPQWTPGAVAAQNVDNEASLATITINADGGTVYGWALLTASAKSATSGLLVSGTKDDDPRANLKTGDKLNCSYAFSATDAG